ncbi:MAG: phospholipid carrier-dependent glycosyltransferase, partial [Thermoanaerobaculia bacterium]
MSRKVRPNARTRAATSGIGKPVAEAEELGPALVAVIAVALLVVYALLVLGNMRINVATVDEPIHLFAGYSDLRWNDRRINPEHPPLVKKLAALPLLAMKPWPSSLDRATDEDQRAGGATFEELRQAWDLVFIDPDALRHLSHDFLYGFRGETLARHGVDDPLYLPTTEQYGKPDFLNDADAMLFRARLPMLGIALLLGVLIFFWSRELWGSLGALLSLALFAFDPNFIGNGGLVTTDVPLAAFMLGAIYFLWRTFRRLTWINAAMTVVFFSLALTSKYSALLLIPIMLWLGIRQLAGRREWATGRGGRILTTRRQKALGVGGLVAATVVVSWFAVWAAYGFRYSVVA